MKESTDKTFSKKLWFLSTCDRPWPRGIFKAPFFFYFQGLTTWTHFGWRSIQVHSRNLCRSIWNTFFRSILKYYLKYFRVPVSVHFKYLCPSLLMMHWKISLERASSRLLLLNSSSHAYKIISQCEDLRADSQD